MKSITFMNTVFVTLKQIRLHLHDKSASRNGNVA